MSKVQLLSRALPVLCTNSSASRACSPGLFKPSTHLYIRHRNRRILRQHPSYFSTSRNLRATQTTDAPLSPPKQLQYAAQEDLNSGVQLMEEGHVELAMDKFNNSILLHPTAHAYYNQGVGYYSLNDVTSAIKVWEKAVAMQPDMADAYCNLANAYISNKKDTETALTLIKTAAGLSPDDPEIQFNYAVILDRVGELENAVKHYKIASQLGVSQAEAMARNAAAKLLAESAQKSPR